MITSLTTLFTNIKLDINVVVVTDFFLHEVAQLDILLNKFKRSPSCRVSFPSFLTLQSFLCFHGDSSCNFIVKMFLEG